MDLQKVMDVYKETSISTAPIIELKIKMLKYTLASIEEGKRAIAEGDLVLKNEALKKSQQLILECMSFIDQRVEPNHLVIATYEYVNQRLIEANIKEEQMILIEIEDILNRLIAAWEEACGRMRKERYKGNLI